jgi:porphobilinogen synthase
MDIQFRPRRLREHPVLRRMVQETRLSVDQLIYPMFVCEGEGIREEILSMPGQFRFSVDTLLDELQQIRELSIPAIMLFGIPNDSQKNSSGSAAYDKNGVICRSLEMAKKHIPDLLLIADVCLCEYTNHGHCGLIQENTEDQVMIHNDKTVEALARTALVYAQAGADVVAPSDMMDGRVNYIRKALDKENLEHIPILSYAAKYASAFYGPFREAASSKPNFGDRHSHQMNPANSREAIKEVSLDIDEGADIVMIKPAMPYLDIIFQARQTTHLPIAAYQVSGEYSALCAACSQNWLKREAVVKESLLSIRRAGADLILTYFAKEVAEKIARGDF